MNWGTSRMKSGKIPKACDSRLRQMTTKDRGTRNLLKEEECSLGRRTIDKSYHWGRSRAKWPSLANNPAQKRVLKEEMLLLEV